MEFTVSAVTNIATTIVDKDNSCPICLECISQDKNTSTTECGHCFHTTCLLKNCSMNGFNCPMCRNNMITNTSAEDNDELDTEADFNRQMRDTELTEFARLFRLLLMAQTTTIPTFDSRLRQENAERQNRIARESIRPENQFIRRYDLEQLNMITDIDPISITELEALEADIEENLARRTVYNLSHGGGRL